MTKGYMNVVLGGFFGDEGKGKSALYMNPDIALRCTGGANAGHTVVFNNKKVVFHLIPSGIMQEKTVGVISNGTVLDLKTLVKEMNELEDLGINLEKLFISNRAHVTFPYHVVEDKLGEIKKGKNSLGTTGRGIGPTYKDKMDRTGITIGNLFEKGIEEKIKTQVLEKNKIFKLYDLSELDANSIIEETLILREKIRPHVIDAVDYLNKSLEEGKIIVAEGAQAFGLDIDFGTYPYVTSSNTTTGGIITGSGVSHKYIKDVVGVIKAHSSRVGEGPYITEELSSLGDIIREQAHEYGATTGRPRRCGWLDLPYLKRASIVNGLTEIAINHIDTFGKLPERKVCIGYQYKDQIFKEYTDEIFKLDLNEVHPIYETIKDSYDAEGITDYDKLHNSAKQYIKLIEDFIGLPVTYIGTGPKNEDIIVRSKQK